jgi:hypothetical protein
MNRLLRKIFFWDEPAQESIVEKSTMTSEALKESSSDRRSVIYGLWTVVLQFVFIMMFLNATSGCVRIDLPELVFAQPKIYRTKKVCRVFHEKSKFFPFCFSGGWWIEGVDYQNRYMSYQHLSEMQNELQINTLPVGTLLKESRSEMQYGFSLWYLFTRYESRRLEILDGELRGLVVISDNFWLPNDDGYDMDVLEVCPSCEAPPP